MSSTPRDDIEAARARGLTLTETALHLGVALRAVQLIWDRMDEIAVEEDHAEPRQQLDRGSTGRLLEPCGTHAAFQRHKTRGQAACQRCRVGERAYQAARARINRARRAA